MGSEEIAIIDSANEEPTLEQDLLTVWIGGAQAPGDLPNNGPLLLVEADPEAAQGLRRDLQSCERVEVCCEVLAAESGSPVCWYLFNDPRLNGPVDGTTLRTRLPNLLQHGEENREGLRLEELLQANASRLGLRQPSTLQVVLQQGDPQATLEGLGDWITGLQRVRLAMPTATQQVWAPQLEAWLTTRGFRAEAEASASWIRDPMATQLLLLQEKDQQIASLQEQLATQTICLSLAQTKHEEELVRVLAGQQEIRDQRNTFRGECDALQAQVEALQVQIRAQNAQMAQQSELRDSLQTQIQEIKAAYEAVCDERNRLLHETSDLHQECSRLRTEQARWTDGPPQSEAPASEPQGLSEQLRERCEKLTLALLHVFPATTYRTARPDLPPLDQSGLVDHFIEYGIREKGAELVSAEEITNQLNIKTKQLDYLEARLALMRDERDAFQRKLLGVESGRHEMQASSIASSSPLQTCASTPGILLPIHLTGTLNASDKWESYFDNYERNLMPFRNHEQEVRLLEIGVQNGGSLEVWKQFLGCNSVITGVDIDQSCKLIELPEGVTAIVGDCSDEGWSRGLCEERGPFDIVIDDGSHKKDDIIKAFSHYFHHIRPGGIYICEDLHAAYWPDFGGSLPNKKDNAIEFFKEIIDLINIEHWESLAQYGSSNQMPILHAAKDNSNILSMRDLMMIDSIEFSNSMVFIRKRKIGGCSLGQRIVSPGKASVGPEVHAENGSRIEIIGRAV